MDPKTFTVRAAGRLVAIPGGEAFVPDPLPPGWRLPATHVGLIGSADRALGELNGSIASVGAQGLDAALFSIPLVQREALASSAIEGTFSTPRQLALFDAQAPQGPAHGASAHEAAREVSNYVRALRHGASRLAKLPLSIRWIRELHERLLEGVRGDDASPGELRRIQNFIGKPGASLATARFVPPPPAEMAVALHELEQYLHLAEGADGNPLVVQLALAHYQFECIHPFRDGNGRVGRLLVPLTLLARGVLKQPLLFVSPYLERRRRHYYDLLLAVSTEGAWEPWVLFFVEAILHSAQDAITRTQELLALRERFRAQLTRARASSLLLELADSFFARPSITIDGAAATLRITKAAASRNLRKLVDAGILTEITGRQRGRVFAAEAILRFIETRAS